MGSAVDPTGLSFTVTKKDGTTASVSPQTHTPTTWGDTAGTQTCTFTYTDGYDSVSCDVEADVQEESPVLTGISVSGTPTGDQYLGYRPDLTGLTVTASYDNGSSQDITNSPDLTFSWTYHDEPETFSYYGQNGTHQTISTGSPTIKICYGGFETSAVEMPVLQYHGVAGLEFRVKDSETSSWSDADVVTDLDDYGCNDYAIAGGGVSGLGDAFLEQSLSTRIYVVQQVADYATDMNKSSYTDSILYDNRVWDGESHQKTIGGIEYTGVLSTTEFGSTAGVQNVTWTVTDDDEGEWTLSLPVTVSASTVSSVTLSGRPTGTQQTGNAPDFTGIEFQYNSTGGAVTKYGNDGITDPVSGKTLATISGSGLTNGVWTVWPPANASDYIVTVTVDDSASGYWKDAGYDIADPAPSTTFDFNVLTVTSVTITGTGDMSAQTADSWVDYTGLTFTYGLSDGTSVVKQGGAGVYDDSLDVAYDSGADIVNGKWVDPLPASSTVTVTVADGSGTWWEDHGYAVASPAPSTTVTFS